MFTMWRWCQGGCLRAIAITSCKYDGSLRDEYQAFLYTEDDERLVVYVPAGTLSYDHRRQARSNAPDGVLEIYFKTRWYSVWHICEQTSNINQMYIHLSMPATVTAKGIEWIDLDLDYRVHLDRSLERLDEDEYRAHTVGMGYPANVQAQVQAACVEIEAAFHAGADPFNHAVQVALYQQIKAHAAPGHAPHTRTAEPSI
jgi:protein associated with RNAse G/E